MYEIIYSYTKVLSFYLFKIYLNEKIFIHTVVDCACIQFHMKESLLHYMFFFFFTYFRIKKKYLPSLYLLTD